MQALRQHCKKGVTSQQQVENGADLERRVSELSEEMARQLAVRQHLFNMVEQLSPAMANSLRSMLHVASTEWMRC